MVENVTHMIFMVHKLEMGLLVVFAYRKTPFFHHSLAKIYHLLVNITFTTQW
jgi:hypothetical protein